MISLDIAGFQTTKYGDGSRHFLCVHGWGGGHAAFEPLLPFLPDDVTLWCPDLPGYGDSRKLPKWELETFVQHASRFLDAFSPEQFTLLGNCSGALFGMVIVGHDFDRCKRMFLIDPFAYFPWYFRLLTQKHLGEFFYRSAFANPIGRLLTDVGVSTGRGKSAHMTRSFETLDHKVVYAYLRMMREIPDCDYFSDLQIPTTLLVGKRSFDAVHKSVKMWEKVWPDCNVARISARHLMLQEASAELSNIVFQ